jgi:hypothetical protein
MLEQRINEMFGDKDPSGFGTGWWSGVLSAFFGLLSFGAVVCLHFPQLLSSPDLRPYYPMPLMRLLIQAIIVGAILFGVASAMLRRKKILALTGILFALVASLLGGASVPINQDLHNAVSAYRGLCKADRRVLTNAVIALFSPCTTTNKTRGQPLDRALARCIPQLRLAGWDWRGRV